MRDRAPVVAGFIRLVRGVDTVADQSAEVAAMATQHYPGMTGKVLGRIADPACLLAPQGIFSQAARIIAGDSTENPYLNGDPDAIIAPRVNRPGQGLPAPERNKNPQAVLNIVKFRLKFRLQASIKGFQGYAWMYSRDNSLHGGMTKIHR